MAHATSHSIIVRQLSQTLESSFTCCDMGISADSRTVSPCEIATHKLELCAEQAGCRTWGGLYPTASG